MVFSPNPDNLWYFWLKRLWKLSDRKDTLQVTQGMLRNFEEYVQSVVSLLCVSCVTYIIFDQRPTSFLLFTITSHFWSKMYLIWDFLFVFYIIQYYHWICWLPTLSITLNKYCLNKKVFSKFKKRYFPQKQTNIEYWLRGLFLASSLINSSCLPNTRHYSKYE